VRVLVVLAHPDPDSFNAALCLELCAGLVEAGHEPDVVDLCGESFDPRMGAAELRRIPGGAPEPEVAALQRRLAAAQGLAFVFPMWWASPPAVLKGFVDRVLQQGYAFRLAQGGMVEGLLPHAKALVLTTTGATRDQVEAIGFARALEKTFDEWTLRMCGVGAVAHHYFYAVPDADEPTRRGYLAEARRLGRESF
jgi:NAD(P)H dehydrogenase (quinone)